MIVVLLYSNVKDISENTIVWLSFYVDVFE